MLRRDLEETIETILGPILGPSMARAATAGHCRALGIDGDTLDADQLEALIGRLTLGLRIFVGHAKSTELADEIRRAAVGSPA